MHTISVLEIGKNFAEVSVSSAPQKITLLLEKTQKVDVDKDGIFDIQLQLLSIDGKEIDLAITLLRYGFTVGDSLVKARVRQSQTFEKKISVKNDWGGELPITLEYPFGIMQVSPEEFALGKDEEHLITLLLNPYNATPEIYTETLTLNSKEGKTSLIKAIPILLEVTSDEVLLDISLDLRKKSLLPGETLEALVSIFNPRSVPLQNVSLHYALQNFQNQKVFEAEEAVSFQEQLSLTKTIPLPANLPAGEYALTVRVVHEGTVATAAEQFTLLSIAPAKPSELFTAFLASKPFFLVALPFLIVAVLIILIVLLLFNKRIKRVKILKSSPPPEVKTIVKRIVVQQKLPTRLPAHLEELKKKLSLVEEGFKRGYISREAYEKTKEKIEKLLNKKNL